MTIETRIEALKVKLAEKRATELCGGPNEQPNQLGIMMRNACVKDFREGASALAELERLIGKIEGLHWAEINTNINLDSFKHLLHEQRHTEAHLEALLASLEAK